MGIAPGMTGSKAARESRRPKLLRILHARVFSCVALVCALLAGSLIVPQLAAQEQDKPEIMPGERRPAKKKDVGPRALAVLQLAANGKTSLVPITILINGKFWDASSYKADPIPMALEPGTVYEAEHTGNSMGLFTVGSALHSNAGNAQLPWLATGAWHPSGMESKIVEVKAEVAPKGIEDADAAPRLTRDPSRLHEAPGSSPASTSPSSGSSTGSSSPPSSSAPTSDKPQSSGSDEPPRLKKGVSPPADTPPASTPSSGQTPTSTSPSGSSAPSTSGDTKAGAADKPADSKAGAQTNDKTNEKANIPMSDSGAAEGARPRLRRGKPAESFADEDVPGYSKPGAKPAKPAADVAKSATTGAPATGPGDVQLIPAISDAVNTPMRPFNFDWLKGEEGDRRKQMVDLAKQKLREYIEAKAKASTPVKSTSAKTGLHTAAAKHVPEPILESVQMTGYDVWKANKPVIVLSATAHLPPPATGGHSEYDSELQYSIVVVAYPDIYNNLHSIYASVTDRFHLDVTPRLELIDAVDVDGDGYGEFLFRQTTDQATGWVIYRATADKMWKMYDSLSPLG